MVAAHKGVTPAPLPDLGNAVAPGADIVAQPQGEDNPDTLFEMISHALGGDEAKPVPVNRVKTDPQATGKQPDRGQVTEDGLPAAEIDDVIRKADQDPGLVPPMDVGQTGATPRHKKANSTLLDVIMQE